MNTLKTHNLKKREKKCNLYGYRSTKLHIKRDSDNKQLQSKIFWSSPFLQLMSYQTASVLVILAAWLVFPAEVTEAGQVLGSDDVVRNTFHLLERKRLNFLPNFPSKTRNNRCLWDEKDWLICKGPLYMYILVNELNWMRTYRKISIYKSWILSVCLSALISDTWCHSFMKFRH